MSKYYIVRQADTDDTALHREDCEHLPKDKKVFLGCFANYYDAMEIAVRNNYKLKSECNCCSSGYKKSKRGQGALE